MLSAGSNLKHFGWYVAVLLATFGLGYIFYLLVATQGGSQPQVQQYPDIPCPDLPGPDIPGQDISLTLSWCLTFRITRTGGGATLSWR